ncbi:MAG: hypothetical protein ACYSU3_23295 [Planctomycetota bacterium]|jgi:hypothetical protein
MRVIEFLDKSGVKYKVTKHEPAFTAQQMAAVEHEPGKYVAKPVIVKADDKSTEGRESRTGGGKGHREDV